MKEWLRKYLRSVTAAFSPSEANQTFLKEAKKTFEEKWNNDANEYTATLADFELIRVLGHGKFGRVIFARYRRLPVDDANSYAAIKVMTKTIAVQNRGPQHLNNEKKILKAVQHPLFIKYKHHFKDNANLFLVTEYVPGGDVYTRLKRIRIFEEKDVIFYSAQIVLCFEYLHYLGIIYRDLKPENVLLDSTGYLKLGDFGLSKKIDGGKTRTMCGTPEYLSPEIVHGRSYSFSVDWWTLGIFIYELIHGTTPFRSANMLQTLRRIVHSTLAFPKPEVNATTQDIINRLLKKNVTERLINSSEIKSMAYYATINWSSLYEQQMPVPYKPVLTSITDTRNFEKQSEIHIDESQTNIFEEEFKDF